MKYHKINPKGKITHVLMAVNGIIALLLSGSSLHAVAQGSHPTGAQPALRGLEAQCLNADPARNAYDEQTGRVRFVGTESGQPIQEPAARRLINILDRI